MNRIYHNQTYQTLLNKLKQLEADRIYCKHDEEHFLAVARIAYIKCLEQSIPVSKELIYCAAVLHDIGKSDQYTKKIPHEIASQKYAEEILQEEGFATEEIGFILKLIADHRKGPAVQMDSAKMQSERNTFGGENLSELSLEDRISTIFYEADKESRNCFCCKAADTCNWSREQRNLSIK